MLSRPSPAPPQASPKLYAALLMLLGIITLILGYHYGTRGLHRYPKDEVWHVPAANRERGPALIVSYGCAACHIVPGVREATGKVGPRLDWLTEQVYIAGVLPNSPQNLIAWIRQPREANPRTAMPDLGVSAEDARDIAAYLYDPDD
jgi:cytochrome c